MRRASASARHDFRRHIAAELRAELVRAYLALGWELPDWLVLASEVPRPTRIIPRGDYLGFTTVTDFPTASPRFTSRPNYRHAQRGAAGRFAGAERD